MAAIGISEFTYGFAFLHEQTVNHAGNITAAPVLPSLQEEQGLGWDAHLPVAGVDFYFQFKLSDYLTNWNAKYILDQTYIGHYYRIALHKKDNNLQHQRLRHLCVNNPHTYYVAPEFNSLNLFNASFLAHHITQSSRLIPVASCNDIHDGQHHITYQHGNVGWIQHSEQKRGEKSYSGSELGALYRGTQKEWVTVDKGFTERLFEKTSGLAKAVLDREERARTQLVRPLLDRPRQEADRRTFLLRTSEILSAVFGVTLVLVGTRK
jgi:hypothetical protein